MKTLLIMRHAKSSWDNIYLSDHERPLKKRGKRDAPRMGQLLQDEDLVPDLIFSSSAVRALSTAEAAASACGYDNGIQVLRTLYHGGPEEFVDVLRNVPDRHERVMIVGHNPGMELFLEELVGTHERLPTAALAQVLIPIDGWSELNPSTEGQLLNLWSPKELPR